ncbi:hypothetical protein V6N13_103105 [Hibiscus sabdariffa]
MASSSSVRQPPTAQGPLIKRDLTLELAIEEVRSCIVNDDVRIVGFYCTPGIEDSRLMTEINKKLSTAPDGFNVVIVMSESTDFDVGRIQDEIGGKIGFNYGPWESRTVEQKAADINEVLSCNRCVVLLHNLWGKVDLNKVGITEPSYENGSKIVFITRSLGVCHEMEGREEIKVVRFESEKEEDIPNILNEVKSCVNKSKPADESFLAQFKLEA